MQLPQTASKPEDHQALEKMKKTYQRFCRQVVLDPESMNVRAILLYFESSKLHASAYTKLQPPLYSCPSLKQSLHELASFNSHLLTEDHVVKLFKDGFHTEPPGHFRVELKPRKPDDNLLLHVSSAASVQDGRMGKPPFVPDEITNGWMQDETFKDELLRMIAEGQPCNVTRKFIFGRWRGCST
eukprot:UN25446